MKNSNSGVTLMEMCVVVALASMIMTIAMVIFNRTTRHYKKGTELMNVQVLMDNITERIRNDIKGLRKIEKVSDKEIKFKIADTADENKEITITYKAEPSNKFARNGIERLTLKRTEAGGSNPGTSEMHSGNQIRDIHFSSEPQFENNPNFTKKLECITMVMQLISDENGEGKDTTMSFVCNFYSNCLDNQL